LNGNLLTLGDPSVSGSGSITVAQSVTNNVINLPIQLGGSTGTFQFVTVNFAADLTMRGTLTAAPGAQPQLTKEGTGTLVLDPDNSGFSGPIKVDDNAGILRINNAKALGDATSGTTVGQNSQLQVNNVAGIIAEPITLNGPGVLGDGALKNIAGNNTWSGNVTLDSDVTLGASAGSLNITGSIGDLGSGHNLTKVGVGQ